jgi:hypothetical protein
MFIKRFLAVAAVAVLSVLGVASNASASTPSCVKDGFCGTLQHSPDGNVLDVWHQLSRPNTPVIAFQNAGNDKATDIVARQPAFGPMAGLSGPGGPVKSFEYSPNDVGSNLCFSDPGPGYGAVDHIVLRPCNNSRWQVFVPYQDPKTGQFSWRNAATNQFVAFNGYRQEITSVKDGAVGTPGNNVPSFDSTQLWAWVQAPAAAS